MGSGERIPGPLALFTHVSLLFLATRMGIDVLVDAQVVTLAPCCGRRNSMVGELICREIRFKTG